MDSWEMTARSAAFASTIDPDFVPRYRIPARRWWQLWKPKWKWIEGVSRRQICRAHGVPLIEQTRQPTA